MPAPARPTPAVSRVVQCLPGLHEARSTHDELPVFDGLFSCGRDGGLTGVNAALLARWKQPLAQLAGKPLPYHDRPASAERLVQDLIRRVLKTGEAVQEEFALPGETWGVERYEATLHPILGPSGEVAGVTGSLRVRRVLPDATASGQRAEVLCSIAEELFLEEGQRCSLAKVFQRIAAAVSADGYIQHAVVPGATSLRAEASHGISPGQIGVLAQIRTTSSATALFRRGLPHVVDHHGAIIDPSVAVLRTAGIRAYACCPLQTGGRVFGAISFVSRTRGHFNESDLRFLQAGSDLIAASIDRNRLLEELRVSRDAAEQASHAKDNFLAVLSHELRTPLNPVLLLASSAAANPSLPPAVRADFELIARNVGLETRLIDDLLDLTRIAHGKLSLHKRRLDLQDILRDALRTVQADVEEKGLTLAVDLTPGCIPVRGDAVRLQQVFWNLLKNAVKFTPPSGRITVHSSTTASNLARVEIADTGIGLTPEEAARAFDCFAQGNHATDGTSSFGGLGLGLSITRNMVSRHGGRIEVTSAGRNQGACFAVELPLAEQDAFEEPPPTNEPDDRGGCRPGTRILLVEDHQPTRQALLQLLVHRHYEVIAAGTMAEAQAIVLRKPFDFVISDIGLPDGTGYELMAGLCRQFSLRGIALTGYGRDHDLALARSAGFVAHLTKPVSIQALEAALAALVPASSRESDASVAGRALEKI